MKTEPSAGPLNAEERLVREIRQRCGENMFRVIAHSICPGIYGHELVKGCARNVRPSYSRLLQLACH